MSQPRKMRLAAKTVTKMSHQVPRKVGHPVNELIDATNKLQVLCFGHFLFDEEKNEAGRNEGECEDDADWNDCVRSWLGAEKNKLQFCMLLMQSYIPTQAYNMTMRCWQTEQFQCISLTSRSCTYLFSFNCMETWSSDFRCAAPNSNSNTIHGIDLDNPG